MTPDGVARVFEILGLPVPNTDRLKRIAQDGRSAKQIRDDLLAWGKKQGGDTYLNMLKSYVSQYTDDPKRQARIAQEISEGRSIDEVRETFLKYQKEGGGGGGAYEGKPPPGERKAKQGIGGGDDDPDTPDLKILKGKEMKWFFDKSSGKWYVEYGLPNSNRSMIFEATPDQMDALFGKNKRPRTYQNRTLKQLTQRQGVTYGGDIAEMEGTGTFEAEVQRVITLALDEGKLPDWAKEDGAALDIIYTAQSEGKNTDWILQELSKLKSFKARFPKIQKFMSENNLSLAEGIAGFLEFEAGINKALQAYGQNIKVNNPQLVGNLLDKGYSLDTINETVAGFARLKEYKPALKAFNEVLKARGMKPMTKIQDMLKFVQGKAPKAMYDLWEQSSIHEAAQAFGLGDVFSVKEAIQAAKKGDFTLETATQGMAKAAELLLRMRHEVDVGKFDLDADELIDISLGLKPRSGRSQSEIFEKINRAVASAQKSLQQQATPFTTFSDTGTPQAASLSGLRQQS